MNAPINTFKVKQVITASTNETQWNYASHQIEDLEDTMKMNNKAKTLNKCSKDKLLRSAKALNFGMITIMNKDKMTAMIKYKESPESMNTNLYKTKEKSEKSVKTNNPKKKITKKTLKQI